MPHNKTSWGAVDKDQLGYESNFNPQSIYHNGPRITDNPLADTPVTAEATDSSDNSYDSETE